MFLANFSPCRPNRLILLYFVWFMIEKYCVYSGQLWFEGYVKWGKAASGVGKAVCGYQYVWETRFETHFTQHVWETAQEPEVRSRVWIPLSAQLGHSRRLLQQRKYDPKQESHYWDKWIETKLSGEWEWRYQKCHILYQPTICATDRHQKHHKHI